MTHLSPEQLLDVADGTRSAADFPHLQSCAACAGQVADLRSAISAAAAVEVPEPSPLFWTHLSQRVREAVAVEQPRASRQAVYAGAWWQWAAAAAVVAVLAAMFMPARQPATLDAPTVAGDVWQPSETPAFDDDPALSLLADLTYGMDWEATAEAGLVPELGAADSVVFTLSDEERVELHRLLQEALGGPGA